MIFSPDLINSRVVVVYEQCINISFLSQDSLAAGKLLITGKIRVKYFFLIAYKLYGNHYIFFFETPSGNKDSRKV